MNDKKNDEKNILINDEVINILNEREKELNCLYEVEEILHNYNKDVKEVLIELLKVIPLGWQFTNICEAKIVYKNEEYMLRKFKDTKWFQSANIVINNLIKGKIFIYYTENIVTSSSNIFLPEEEKLLNTIAERLSQYISHIEMKKDIENWSKAKKEIELHKKDEWKIVIDLLKKTDIKLYFKISRKMLNYLSWTGAKKAKKLLGTCSFTNENIPIQKLKNKTVESICDSTFDIASEYINGLKIFELLQKWIKENKISFLVNNIEDINTSISDIIDAITKYINTDLEKVEFTNIAKLNTSVMIIRRFFSDQLAFINVAKKFVDIEAFYNILKHTIFPNNSRGKLGGKSSGIFLAYSIIKEMQGLDDDFKIRIKTPKTWYITSDTLMYFLNYNNLEEVFEQKYKEIDQIRQEYPNIVQVFKNSKFPPEIIKGLSNALDDFGDKPLVVRSSSLLEDRFGSSFSGKYKSLFIANQGGKEDRLNALLDAISEVYASTFGPDPIEYRKERELLDFYEGMAVMIQEVVGKKVGKYYFPAFAGVGFSNNEFRWSKRIERDDGLLRIVPGLGTRAVDRLSNDFPVLIAPGKPNIRANTTIDEIFRYSPKLIDVINLETNTFETIDINSLLKERGRDYPIVDKLFSVVQEDRIINKSLFNIDFKNDDLVFTFNNFVKSTSYIKNVNIILNKLQEKIKAPVDIEFAHDGKDFYLLQCRPQGSSTGSSPSSIPKDIKEKNIVFTAKKYISNGKISDILYIVYVKPEKYGDLTSLEELESVGRAIGKLNSILPKKKFILMGPGRWGSRGDIKLGVNVTYSDINNTAVLIEVAREKGNYIPDLSFGTHFFQDMVEASIRYIPLYPDNKEIVFNELFLNRSNNILPELIPDFTYLEDVVTVIDMKKEAKGKILRILMNADLNEAIAYLELPSIKNKSSEQEDSFVEPSSENHWMWRLRMAEHIAKNINSEYFGIVALYVFGSTKNANCGPASDIDLLVHLNGNEKQKQELKSWFEGWSLCLSEINYLKTGYRTDGLLDVHYITDEDIKNKNSFAIKINAITDAARLLTIKK